MDAQDQKSPPPLAGQGQSPNSPPPLAGEGKGGGGYRALLQIPYFPRTLIGTALQRTGGQMVQIAIVLFVLARFHSPSLAGLTVFLQITPGLLVSPIAGALLDRYGRVRLMLIDFTVAAITLAVIVLLSSTHHLVVPVLLGLVTISSLTAILSVTGVRSLFPLMVPRDMWDRVNGIDSSLYAITTIVGPPLAAVIVAVAGPEAALLATALTFALTAVVMLGVKEPKAPVPQLQSVWRDAYEGLRYVVRNQTLRGLAVSICTSNIGLGGIIIAIPVLLLSHLHTGTASVGLVFGVFGVVSLISALVFGRMNTEGRERVMLAASMVTTALAMAILAFANSLWVVFAAAILAGALLGAADVSMFGIRQRRTDPSWFGRAFAVSMALNYIGTPIGSAITGAIITRSIAWAFLFGAVFNVISAVLTMTLIPA